MDLSTLVKQELDRRGWSQNRLSEVSELSVSLINRIIHDKEHKPKYKTLLKLANALELPFARVAEAAGFDVTTYSPDEEDREILQAMSAMPEFREFWGVYQQFDYQDRMAVLAMVKGLLHYRPEKQDT